MKRIGLPILATAALAFALVVPHASAMTDSTHSAVLPPVVYTIKGLGVLPGDGASTAAGLNNWGNAVGSSVTIDPVDFMPQRPVWFTKGTIRPLPTLGSEPPGLTDGDAVAINDGGIAVGEVYGPKGPTHAAVFSPSGVADLGVVIFDQNSYATAINSLGQIVGYTVVALDNSGPYTHGVLYAGNGQITDLGALPGGRDSFAMGINDQGIVVGYAPTADNTTHALIFAHGQVTDLGVPAGGTSSAAYAINGQGQIAGAADFGSGKLHGALFANGTITDLGTLPGGSTSTASAINNTGQAVGWSDDSTGRRLPVLFSGGQVISLGIPSAATDGYAAGINDLGQIVGTVDLATTTDLPDSRAAMWVPGNRFSLSAAATGP